MPLRPGETVEHFVIVAMLGEGGMGQVYVARDTRLERLVALKIVHPAKHTGAVSEGRLVREARAAAALDHPNVVTIYEVGEIPSDGEDAARPFIAMELVKGRPLRAFIGDERVPLTERVRWLADVARALAAAHRARLIHRDIKPENVMVRDDGAIKVLDFGLAKRTPLPVSATSSTEGQSLPHTQPGIAVGTPSYMAPEQMRGEYVDGRADQFSWGVMAYELLSGAPPWGKDVDALQLVSKLLTQHPRPLRDVRPDVPLPVAAAVARAMSKEREDRFATIDELLDAISGNVRNSDAPRASFHPPNEERSGPAFPLLSTQVAPATSRRSRRRGLAAAAFIALVAAASASAAWLVMARRGSLSRSLVSATEAQAPRASIRTIVDWPAPETSVPEAAVAYAAALNALHDAKINVADIALRRAVSLDPHLTAASLRLALLEGGAGEEITRLIATVAQARASLAPRDQQLFAFDEAVVRDPSNHLEILPMASRLAIDAADDPEVQLWLARILTGIGLWTDASAALDRALAKDPKFALAEHERALLEMASWDLDGALAAASRCLSIAPSSSSCLRRRFDVKAFRGQCDALEADARVIVAVEPDGPGAYTYLADALQAKHAPMEAVAQAYGKAAALVEDPSLRKAYAAGNGARLAIYAGDFTRAEAQILALDTQVASSLIAYEHPIASLLDLYEEEGAGRKAIEAAERYLRTLPSWVEFSASHDAALALTILRRARRVSDEEARRRRKAWVETWRNEDPDGAWAVYYASVAGTRSEANEALAALPDPSSPPMFPTEPTMAGWTGRTYWLAGDAVHAIPLLRAETSWCGTAQARGFDPVMVDWQIERIRDFYVLGRALEQTGDVAGACAAYNEVLNLWGAAKPRSTTAQRARERLTGLACH